MPLIWKDFVRNFLPVAGVISLKLLLGNGKIMVVLQKNIVD